MIHTMELTTGLCKEEFRAYKSYVAEHPDEISRQQREGFKNKVIYLETLKDHGIRFCVPNETYDTGWNGVQMYIKVTFGDLAAFENPIQVSTAADIEVIQKNFTALMSNLPFITEFTAQLDNWKVHRVDYSTNCNTSEVANYLKFLRHGDRVNRRESNKNNAGCSQKYNNLHHPVRNTKGKLFYTFNFYDKQAERIDKKKSQREIDAAKDILRIEMECHADKIKDLRKKFKIPNQATAFFNWDICEYVLLNLGVDQILKDAPFYRRAFVKQWIEENTQGEKQKRLLNYLQQVNGVEGTVYRTKQHNEKMMEDLRILTDNGFNIVTLRDSERTPTLNYSKTGCLPSVQTLVREALELEKTRETL